MKLFLATSCLALVTFVAGFAQQPKQQPGQTPGQNTPGAQAPGQNTPNSPTADQNRGGQATSATEFTGCLSKSGNTYALNSKGEKYSLMGADAQLGQHADQEVKITGQKSTKDGKTSLQVTRVEMVNATCTTRS